MVDALLDILDNPYKPIPAGEIMLCHAFQEFVISIPRTVLSTISSQIFGSFWVRGMSVAPSSTTVKHFRLTFTDYLEAVVVQAQHRDDHTLFQTVEEYVLCRREDIAIRPLFFPCQLHLNIPDEALFHPVITKMEYLIALIVSIDNVSLFLVHAREIMSTCSV